MREKPLGQTHKAVAETGVFFVSLPTGVASASLDCWIGTLVFKDGQAGSDHLKLKFKKKCFPYKVCLKWLWNA